MTNFKVGDIVGIKNMSYEERCAILFELDIYKIKPVKQQGRNRPRFNTTDRFKVVTSAAPFYYLLESLVNPGYGRWVGAAHMFLVSNIELLSMVDL